MTREQPVSAAAMQQKFEDMREADLLKFLRESALKMSAAVDRLETLTTSPRED